MSAVVIAVGVVVVLAVATARLLLIGDPGVVPPFFDTYEVGRARLLGAEIYVDRSSGLGDVMVVLALSVIAATFLLGARAVPHDAALRRTFVTAGLGSAFLAADDLLGVHETIGHNLGFFASLPGIDHPDDLIVGIYGLAVLAFGWRHRGLLAGRARVSWCVAAAAGGGAVLHDITALHMRVLEESLEVVAACALVVTVGLVVHGRVGARDASPERRRRDPRTAASRMA